MKRTILLACLLCCGGMLYAQFGILDNTFGSSGIVTTDVNNLSVDVGQALVIQGDGKMIAGGWYNKTNTDSFCLIRYNQNGTVDNTFGSNGIVITPFSNGKAVALQADGKILLAGGAHNGFGLARYNSDGSLDNTFGTMGLASNSFVYSGASCSPSAIAVAENGRIFLGGEAFDISQFDASAFALACYQTNGTLDSTFGTNGTVITDITPGSGLGRLDGIRTLKIQTGGKIVAGGYAAGNKIGLVRYLSTGVLDNTFGTMGIVTTQIKDGALANELILQNDNKIVIAGSCTDTFGNFMLARYHVNGTLDSSFGLNGIVINRFSPEADAANALVLQPNGSIVAAGSARINNTTQFALSRYDATGALDNTFGTNGLILTSIPGFSDAQIRSISLQWDGKLVVCGNSHYQGQSSDFILARYTSGLPLDVENMRGRNTYSAQVYPNPSTTQINLDYTLEIQEEIRIDLVDITGRVVEQIQAFQQMDKGAHKHAVSLVSLTNGIYFLQMKTRNASVSFKVVKQ